MTIHSCCRTCLPLMLLVLLAAPLAAAPNWKSLLPFHRVEADPEKNYELSEKHGPWLIMAASFTGDQGEKQAHTLMIELRKRYGLKAYMVKHRFDFSQPVRGLGVMPDGSPRIMRYQKEELDFESYAVLVGDFESVYDTNVEKVLEKIKYASPECLDLRTNRDTNQSFAWLREFQRRINRDETIQQMGPMRTAFLTRNPLLPEEYFAPRGLDPFVAEMNDKVEYSLLKCPGRYSVKVAMFRGDVTMDSKRMQEIEREIHEGRSKLAIGAARAHQMTLLLREQGVEAYEFHDRTESIVCVGSFASVGEQRPDGKLEINPAVHRIMQSYAAEEKNTPGLRSAGKLPKTIQGIPFDMQPTPVEVPRKSIAVDYARRGSFFD